ncbi:MAG: hypothetical protein R2769_09220 [Saprospiraceae bacterium]
MNYTIEVDEEIEEDIFGVPTMIVNLTLKMPSNTESKQIQRTHPPKIRPFDDSTLLCIIKDDGIGRKRLQEKE